MESWCVYIKKNFELKKENQYFKLDTDLVSAFNDFIKNTCYGTFTFIIQGGKVIGYDCLVKKRITNN